MGTAKTYTSLSADAVKPEVFLYKQSPGSDEPSYGEGHREPRLHVETVTWRTGGAISTASIVMSLDDQTWKSGTARVLAENYRNVATEDDIVVVALPYVNGTSLQNYALFIGFLADPVLIIKSAQEVVQFTAYALEKRLTDIHVSGQTVRSPARDQQVIAGTVDWATTFAEIGGKGGDDDTIAPTKDTIGIHEPLIFNPGGKPNASIPHMGGVYTGGFETDGTTPAARWINLFEGVGRTLGGVSQTKRWMLDDAINYLLWVYNPDEIFIKNPDGDYLYNLCGQVELNNVDLRSSTDLMSVLQAVFKGTDYAFGFRLNPGASSTFSPGDSMTNDAGASPAVPLLVWKKGEGPIVDLTMPKITDSSGTEKDVTDLAGADTAAITIKRRTVDAYNKVVVIGDYKYFQHYWRWYSDDLQNAESDMIAAWIHNQSLLDGYFDPNGELDSDKEDSFAARYNRSGTLHPGYIDDFRAFALNETGEYYADPMLYNMGTALLIPHKYRYDWSLLFGNDRWYAHRRRFYKTVEKTRAKATEYYEPELRLSFDDGGHWFTTRAFEVLKDECKIRITANDLNGFKDKATEESTGEDGLSYIQALQQSKLWLLLKAAVHTDERVQATHIVPEQGVTRFARTRQHHDQAYKWQDFYGNPTAAVKDITRIDTKDHTAKAMLKATELGEVLRSGQADCNPVLPGINMQYFPGQRVRRVKGRLIPLHINRFGTDIYPEIVGVKWMFGRGQKPQHQTVLELDMSTG